MPAAHASTITFVTPSGSSTGGGPVNASANVTTNSNGTVSIMLNDLQANPTDVAQLISDFAFTLSNGATGGTLFSQTASLINVLGDGTTTSGGTGSPGWLMGTFAGGVEITRLGGGQPAGLIIGPAGPGGVYTNANGSIAGNGPHNPFSNQSATFVVTVAGVTADTTITSAIFSFGTTAGINVPGIATPLPGALALLGPMLGIGYLRLRRRRPRALAAA
jgi:hypothetical protein